MRGARGHAARESYLAELSSHPCEFTQDFRKLLAREMETELELLQPAALRGFFERRVAFGQHRLLQHLGAMLARMWELAEQSRGSELQAFIAASAAFVEQTALDGGRTDVSWLLTGLAPPAAQAPSPVRSQRPGATLLPPKWLSANIANLQDLDFLATRGATQKPPAPPKAPPADGAGADVATPRPRPKRGARGGGAGGAAAPAAAA